MNILITGGCGFVGSNIALKLKSDYSDFNIFVLDNLSRRGAELSLKEFKNAGIEFKHCDIRNQEDFNELGEFDLIIDASAEPSVLAGLDSTSGITKILNINLFGTVNILNFAAQNKAKVIFLSTSRVYSIKSLLSIKLEENDSRFEISDHQDIDGITKSGISENFSTEGHRSVYGASKLCGELLIDEYREFYNLDVIVNRCSVISGPKQMGKIDQGVTVLWVAKHFWSQSLKYIGFNGSGKQVRDVIHIDDLYDLVNMQINDFQLFSKGFFNIGGSMDSSFSLRELTKVCEEVTGNKINISAQKENRVADIPLFVSDIKKVEITSGWKPKMGVTDIVEDIFHWLRENEDELISILK